MNDKYYLKLAELLEKMNWPKEKFIDWLNDGEAGGFSIENYYRDMVAYARSTIAMVMWEYKYDKKSEE